MRLLARLIVAPALAALLAAVGGCEAPPAAGVLVARSPDGMRIAVANSGARNVRVLHVNGPSIVRLHEGFVPDGEAIVSIAWSGDGRDVVVATRGATYALDTKTGRLEHDADGVRRIAHDGVRRH